MNLILEKLFIEFKKKKTIKIGKLKFIQNFIKKNFYKNFFDCDTSFCIKGSFENYVTF